MEENLPNEILAKNDTIALVANWTAIRGQLKANSRCTSMNIFRRLNKIKKLNIFKHLSESKLLCLCSSMKKHKFNAGEYICMENTMGDEFFLINKGHVKVLQDGVFVREMESGNCFGEISILNEAKRTASVIAIDEVHCYTLTKADFLKMIDENMLDYLKKKISLEDTSIQLSELYYLSFLGKGKFGSVCLVHNKTSIYAIKSVSRKAAERQKSLARYLLHEKNIMLTIDHPFIVKLVKTLKNDAFCFYLMEYIHGRNLEEYLLSRKMKKNINETRFYAACLISMIEYLHKKKIAHRDIKPCNIMVDANGYLKLIDFGTAKKITDFTHTVIGTPHFMAPEVLNGKGYSFSSDYWSIGICIFFIFYGYYPLGQNAHDVMDIYRDIIDK
jgi:cGMP-dependent protein kinase